jgi:hypothetical protein
MRWSGFLAAAVLAGAWVHALSTPSAALEVPRQGHAEAYLGGLARGANYKVSPVVRSDGLMRIFIVDTTYGQFQVNGLDLMRTRIRELKAIEALERMLQSDVFIQEVRATLQQLGVPADSVSCFVDNRFYTPVDLLLISRALARLRANNTKAFIDRVAEASGRDIAFFQRRRAELLANRSGELGGIADFITVAGFPINRTRNGNIVAAFPFDEIAWTEIPERTFNAATSEMRRSGARITPIFATSGAVTPMAAREIEKLGWKVVQLK